MKVDLYFATTDKVDLDANPPDFGSGILPDDTEWKRRVDRAKNESSQWVALAFDTTGMLRFVYEIGMRKKPSLRDVKPVEKYDPNHASQRKYIVTKAFSPTLGSITKEQALAGKTQVLGPIRGDMTENPYAFSAENATAIVE